MIKILGYCNILQKSILLVTLICPKYPYNKVMELPLNEQIIRLLLAVILGSVVGLEREYVQQYAGLRTHILVCLGAAVFTLISISDLSAGMGVLSGDGETTYRLVRDPARIAAQVVTGIGFIGGGAVLRNGSSIRGLTTAASLWMMGSIGMLVGVGSYQLAIVATIFSFLVLFLIGTLERSVFHKHQKKYTRYKIQVTLEETSLDSLTQWIESSFPKKVLDVKTQKNPEQNTLTLICVIEAQGFNNEILNVTNTLNKMPGVSSSAIRVFHENEK
jgi:putative Mg2+ transporter-C (MgtC) family protein